MLGLAGFMKFKSSIYVGDHVEFYSVMNWCEVTKIALQQTAMSCEHRTIVAFSLHKIVTSE